ncbi:MAG: hypothetical protein LBI88_00120 [Deltaproteobacteria bacterium]|jgi:hypothetical protein|nr:hypothetical protein [Deltaproteobacteria bacterium]
MEHVIIPAPPNAPLDRIYIITLTMHTFKGRRNVEAHLFRSAPDPAELQSLRDKSLIGKPCAEPIDSQMPHGTEDDALQTVLEAFTAEEGNLILDYLKERYADQILRVTVCPLELPVPLGVVPLSAIPEGKTMGFIRFDAVRDYPLPFVVRGFYDLDAHEPLVPEGE